jgi:hypothetical protein
MNRRRFLGRTVLLLVCFIAGTIGREIAAAGETPRRVAVTDVLSLRDLAGRSATVGGRVTATSVSRRSGYHFLNFDNREFCVVCFASDLGKFKPGGPAELYKGRDIEITGLVERYEDKLQIRLREPAQIKFVEPTAVPPVPSSRPGKVELKKLGAETWLSPAGLRYQGRDPEGRTRVEHILRHARDIPEREGAHGVFDGGPDAVFGVLDEAWRNVEKIPVCPACSARHVKWFRLDRDEIREAGLEVHLADGSGNTT